MNLSRLLNTVYLTSMFFILIIIFNTLNILSKYLKVPDSKYVCIVTYSYINTKLDSRIILNRPTAISNENLECHVKHIKYMISLRNLKAFFQEENTFENWRMLSKQWSRFIKSGRITNKVRSALEIRVRTPKNPWYSSIRFSRK